MKKLLPIVALLALSAPAIAQNSLEKRVEALELANDLNWVKVGGSLETRYDYVDYERNKDYVLPNLATGGAVNYNKGGSNDYYYRMWANLNIDAKPSDRLSFFGRLSMAKYFNTMASQGDPSGGFDSFADGIQPNRSFLFVERAFANYNITDSVIFTMGRLPTVDGPNKHIALNQQLMGNYPTLAYSGILDGFALTKTMKPSNDSVFRTKVIYTPLQTVNYNSNFRLEDSNGNKVQTASAMSSVLLEYEKSNGSFFDQNLTIFQYLRGEQNPFWGTDPAGNPSSDLYVSVNRYVLYSDFQKLFNTNFDFAAQFMYSDVRSRGHFNGMGWMTSSDDDHLYGTASVLTARYQLPIKALNNPKIGAEWFHGSEEAYLYDVANVNPINMYGSPDSDVYHLFWNQTFDGGLSLNTGYMYRNQKTVYQAYNLFGAGQKTDNVDQNIYVSLLAVF